MGGWHAVILAAGQGTRMRSARPKVMHAVAGLPMIAHVLRTAAEAGAGAASLVLPPEAGAFAAVVANSPLPVQTFVQAQRLGTAHAVLAASAGWSGGDGPVLVLYGDAPLIGGASLWRLADAISGGADVAVLGFEARQPHGYGRLIVEDGRSLTAIVEEKDATPAQKRIALCNSGLVAFRGQLLPELLERIGNANAAGEYYLTDAIGIAHGLRHRVDYDLVPEDEVQGVNTRAQLAQAEAAMQQRLRHVAMDGGATLIAPETVTLCYDTVIGQDVLIEPHVIFGPGVTVESDVTIKGFSHIEGAHIGRGAAVGPFARIRPATVIGEGARVGNFVEVKEARIDAGAKINHLSYVGDATVGRDANVGAGVITCNYDGFEKHRTIIGADAFVGSNSALVAPVEIGEGAFVGSGSVIVDDVPAGSLAIARGKQETREGWAEKKRSERQSRNKP